MTVILQNVTKLAGKEQKYININCNFIWFYTMDPTIKAPMFLPTCNEIISYLQKIEEQEVFIYFLKF